MGQISTSTIRQNMWETIVIKNVFFICKKNIYILINLFAGPTAYLVEPNSISDRESIRPDSFNRIWGKEIKENPIWLSFLPANHLFS